MMCLLDIFLKAPPIGTLDANSVSIYAFPDHVIPALHHQQMINTVTTKSVIVRCGVMYIRQWNTLIKHLHFVDLMWATTIHYVGL